MNSKQVVRMGFVLGIALALGGCGGGSSSSGSSNPFDDFVRADGARDKSVKAANAVPNPGSVTQSSNSPSGTTLDQIVPSVTFNGGDSDSDNLRIGIKNGTQWEITTEDPFFDGESVADEVDEITFHRRIYRKSVSDGSTVFVDVYTDRADAANDFTDYMVGGVWVQVPEDLTSVDDLEIGAFVDRKDTLTASSYLRQVANATYDGSAVGLVLTNIDGGDIDQFFADVRLLASFDNSPTINGEIEITDDLVLLLESAQITDVPGGFFTGDTRFKVEDEAVDDPSGKWGGQFYGDTAQHAIGTFGASISDVDLGDSDLGEYISVVGAFTTDKEEP